MSPLAAFFQANPDRKRIELARYAGIQPAFVTQMCKAKKKPGRQLAVKIAEWTNGAVRPEDWDQPGFSSVSDRASTRAYKKSGQ